MTKETLRCGWG